RERLNDVRERARDFGSAPYRLDDGSRNDAPAFGQVFGEAEVEVRLALERDFELDVVTRVGAPRIDRARRVTFGLRLRMNVALSSALHRSPCPFDHGLKVGLRIW